MKRVSAILNGSGWLLIGMVPFTIGVLFWHRNDAKSSAGLQAGVFLALGAQLLTQAKVMREKEDKQSAFYLDASIAAYKEAADLLREGGNDRAVWIAAARTLSHADSLGREVMEPPHVKVLELARLRNRRVFYNFLQHPAAYFYGAAAGTELDAAAAASTAGETHNGRHVTSTVNELSPKSIRQVWLAAKWPDDYQDPAGVQFTAEEEGSLMVLFPGIYEYLQHRKRWSSASGRVFPSEAALQVVPEKDA